MKSSDPNSENMIANIPAKSALLVTGHREKIKFCIKISSRKISTQYHSKVIFLYNTTITLHLYTPPYIESSNRAGPSLGHVSTFFIQKMDKWIFFHSIIFIPNYK